MATREEVVKIIKKLKGQGVKKRKTLIDKLKEKFGEDYFKKDSLGERSIGDDLDSYGEADAFR